MVAFLYFAAVLAISAGLGYLVRRLQRGLHWAWVVSISLLLAFIFTAISGIVFLYAGLSYPVSDDPRFKGSNSIYIARVNPIEGQDLEAIRPHRC
jgi:hypothetical protein